MKKIITFIFSFFFFTPLVLSAEINFSADKTSGSTDDIFQINLSVDGEIDGGEIGIEGLEGFKIVGQQTSSKIQITNGNLSSIQEKIISIKPKTGGDFILTALAKEKGKIIKSKPISFKIEKSLIESTKEKLLKNTTKENKNIEDKNLDLKTEPLKELLKSSKSQDIDFEKKKTEKLKIPKIEKFPKVEHLSAFNAIFWFEFLGISLILLVIFLKLQKIIKKS